MSDVASRTTVDIGQIARIAKVGRSAVGNWRKRHSDFPVPDSSKRFDLVEVERWLIEKGKIDSRVPDEFALWSLIDSLRSFGLRAEQITELLVSMLIYLEACDVSIHPAHHRAGEITIDNDDHWRRLCQNQAGEVGEELSRAARNIEEANPALEGLLVDGLSVASSLPNDLLVSLMENFEASVDNATPRISLFNKVVSRARKIDRFRGEHSTPPDITNLMIQLAGQNAEIVCDLACGEGGLLSSAVLSMQSQGSSPVKLVGYETEEGALKIARSRFFLQGVTVDLHLRDTFQVPQEELPKADVVLLDPPLAMKDWGDADIYLDERWSFGEPPRLNADLAWMQLAVQCLSDNGVAIVAASPATAKGDGREAEIRMAMLKEGVIKAVIQLPSRLRTETNVPVALWVLQSPESSADTVLLIEASGLGKSGRSEHDLDPDGGPNDIDRIARAFHAYETGRVEDDEIAWVVSTTDVIDKGANLEPKTYRPFSELDIEDVCRRSEMLKAKLPNSASDAATAMGHLSAPREKTGGNAPMKTLALEKVTEMHRAANTSKFDAADDGVLLVGIPEISAGDASTARYIDIQASSAPLVEVKEGDVVVALWSKAGKTILAGRHHDGAVLDKGCALIRPIGDKISGEWIYLWTQSKQFRDQVSRSSSGVTIPSLTSRALRELTIPIPTAEQLSEAEQLIGRFDEAIDKVGELQSDLRELRDLEVELLIAHDAGTE